MSRPGIDPDAFNAFEAAAWEAQAEGYDRFFGAITSRVAEPLLDAAAVGDGTRTLDVATGPGYVAGQAAARGAAVIGVDGAGAMIDLARRLQPGVDFRQGDAHALPFDDAAFDAVVANFLVLHLGRPEVAAGEFARVLAPGGRAALTAWDLPGKARFFGTIIDAVAEAGATPPDDIPAGPDIFRFAADDEFDALLGAHGLVDRRVETVAFSHRVASADELWDGILGGTVRVSALIRGQPDDTYRRIRQAFDRRVEEFRGADGLDLPVSVKLASGRKP